MNVGIFGLGYVGVVNAACLTKLGHKVIGCDIKAAKVDMLNSGKSPIFEPQVDDLLNDAINKKLLSATTSVYDVVANSDILIICVGTPSNSNGDVNLDFIYNTSFEIANEIKKLNKSITLLYRSTIPPNTLTQFIKPIYNTVLKENNHFVKLAFYPEFLREGKAVEDFFNAPRIVIGSDEEDLKVAKELLNYNKNIPVFVTNPQTSEFVKYVDNTFHALKVAFVNEVYELAKKYNVDVSLANEIFLTDKSLNISTAYLKPGLPFGGSCLPKDLRAMNAMAKVNDLQLPLLASVSQSNSKALDRLENLIEQQQKKKLFFVGFTFKNNTDDYRESPVLFIIENLIKKGYEVKFNDIDANLVNLRIDKPSLVKHYEDSIENGIYSSELLIVSKRYLEEVIQHNTQNKIIINCTGKSSKNTTVINLY